MEITVIKGNTNYIDDCEEALLNSELGRRYFSEEGKARRALEEGFSEDELYVATDNNNNCMGFVWVILDGIFHAHPYVHIIAVKSENRGQGIGKKLLKYIEDIYFEKYSKLFLVVSDFNPEAKKLYKDIGYIAIGDIPNLYRQGISECLMMKSKE
jgi:ribosomal protein S18 acetylase RimI-like enzyme